MKEIINDYLAVINNWLGVIGFVITLATLAMTLNIRGQIEKSRGKQRFLEMRDGFLNDLTAIRLKLMAAEKTLRNPKEMLWTPAALYDGLQVSDAPVSEAVLLELHALAAKLLRLRIWKHDDQAFIRDIVRSIEKGFSNKKGSENYHVSKNLLVIINQLIAIVDAQSVV